MDIRDLMQNITALAEGSSLNSVYEVEDVLLLIQEFNKKLDYYKELKDYRVNAINAQIASLTQKSDALRNVIYNTMLKVAPKEKTLNFPAVGKVSRRKGVDTYEVSDQGQVIEFLDRKGVKDDIVKVEEKIDKRKLKTAIEQFQKTGEVVPGVNKVEGQESLSISFEKESSSVTQQQPVIRGLDLDELDSLIV